MNNKPKTFIYVAIFIIFPTSNVISCILKHRNLFKEVSSHKNVVTGEQIPDSTLDRRALPFF